MIPTELLHAGSSVDLLHAGPTTVLDVELAVFFLVGLLGGAHCLGMCGPLVTMYADQLSSGDQREGVLSVYEVRQHALFNLGRTASYAVLGGLFGLVGGLFFDLSGTVQALGTTVRAATGIVVGGLILLVGGRYLLGNAGGHGLFGGHVLFGGLTSRVYSRVTEAIDGWVTGPGIVALGLVHGFLPCPLLYPAFLYAFAQGSAVGGTLALGVLGVGTFPTLFLYGTVVQSVGADNRARLHRVLGLAFLLLGWMPLAHGLELFGIHVPHIELPIYQPLAQ